MAKIIMNIGIYKTNKLTHCNLPSSLSTDDLVTKIKKWHPCYQIQWTYFSFERCLMFFTIDHHQTLTFMILLFYHDMETSDFCDHFFLVAFAGISSSWLLAFHGVLSYVLISSLFIFLKQSYPLALFRLKHLCWTPGPQD